MVVVRSMEEAESTGGDPLLLTRNLLEIAIYNISYIRGLFPEKYFNDNFVPTLEMRIKKLMPMDDESRHLINVVEKGIYGALQKKYLKTLLFRICEKEEGPMIEEYAFSFSYPNINTKEVAINMSRTGSKNSTTTFKTNTAEVTPRNMRCRACMMIRAIISLMRTVKPMPEERTILMKLLYNDGTITNICCDNDNSDSGDAELDGVNESEDMSDFGDNASHQEVITAQVTKWICLRTRHATVHRYLPSVSMTTKSGYVFVASSKKIKFLLDSGATHHICNDVAVMKELKNVEKENQITVYSASGQKLKAKKIGVVVYEDFKLSQVGLIPEMPFNVVSVGQLAMQGLVISTGDSRFSIISPNDARLIGEGFLQKKREKGTGREYYEYIFRTMDWIYPKDIDTLVDYTAYAPEDELKPEWWIDTGCARHMVPSCALLKNPRCKVLPFQSASGTFSSSHEGSVRLGELELKDVLCVSAITDNLISGPMLDLNGYRIVFSGTNCSIVHKDGLKVKGRGTMDEATRMYLLDDPESAADQVENRVTAQRDNPESKYKVETEQKGKKRRRLH